jgi:hypothetical protein
MGGTSRTATRTATTELPNSTAAIAAPAFAGRSAGRAAVGRLTGTLRLVPIRRPREIDCLNGSPIVGGRLGQHGSSAGNERHRQPGRHEPLPPPDPDHRLHR